MLQIRQAIIVEGKYDKIKLSSLVKAVIIQTNGFGIFKDREKLALLRRIADRRGLVVLTDSDGAGFVIRNFLRGALPKDRVLHAYVPDIYGKERRKEKPGKEGKLGVEGMDEETLLRAPQNAGVQTAESGRQRDPITKYDLYTCGLSGHEGSQTARKKLLHALELPERMSANALLQALNVLYDREEFLRTYSNIGD